MGSSRRMVYCLVLKKLSKQRLQRHSSIFLSFTMFIKIPPDKKESPPITAFAVTGGLDCSRYSGSTRTLSRYSTSIVTRKRSGFQYHFSPNLVRTLSEFSRDLVGNQSGQPASSSSMAFIRGIIVPHIARPKARTASFFLS